MPALLHCLVQDSHDCSFPLSKPRQLLRPDTVTRYRWRLQTSSAHTAGANPPGRASWCMPDPAVHLLKHLEHEGLQWPISWETGHISPCREPGPHWTDPQGRTDTPASRKEGISLTFSLARQWVCLKKNMLPYLCSSLLSAAVVPVCMTLM